VPAENCADYYKKALVIPFIDDLLAQLRDRFSQENRVVAAIFAVIPGLIITQNPQEAAERMKPWEPDLPTPRSLPSELRRWKFHWEQKKEEGLDVPETMKAALPHADVDAFPNIRMLLFLGMTFPITSAEAERSFSLFRRLKTYLRSRMTDTRLSALAHMSAHYSIHLSPKDVAGKLIQSHPRRLFTANLFCDLKLQQAESTMAKT